MREYNKKARGEGQHCFSGVAMLKWIIGIL